MTLMSDIVIQGRTIGPGHPPFVVAEAGINHNGSVENALEMVRVAKRAGADEAKEFVGDPEQTYTYRSQGRGVTEPMLDMFKRVELPPSAWPRIKRECDDRGIVFMSTPQNVSDLELLLEVGISAIKIGSDDFTNLPLIHTYARAGLPLILSCGMADLGEVHQALDRAGALTGHPTVLLLCTSQYRTPPGDVNLARLRTLSAAYPGLVVGFSDHTQGPLALSLAVALGACVFEKHFTLDHDLPGPDHWFSEDPPGLEDWVTHVRTAATMLGSPLVRPTDSELEMRVLARRSIVALAPIRKGSALRQRTSERGGRAEECRLIGSRKSWLAQRPATFAPASCCG